MMKVRVQNFQSIKDATVEIDGFTVITGRNNSGKSAFMRAIRAAFQNPRGTSYIRRGADKCTVEIDFGDGNTLKWEKGRKRSDKPVYVINGGEPIYPGQGVPDEVMALGVRPIDVGRDQVWPQFAPQFTGQLFLVNQPGSALAEAISDVDRVSQLNQALRLAESDKRATHAEIKVRAADELTQVADLAKFDGLDDLALEINKLIDQESLVLRIEKALVAATELRNRLQKARKAVDDLKGIDDVEVPSDAVINGLIEDQRKLKEITVLRDRWEGLTAQVHGWQKSLDGAVILDVVDVDGLISTQKDLKEITGLRDRWLAITNQVVRWQKGLDHAGDVDGLDVSQAEKYSQAIDKLTDLRSSLDRARSKVRMETDDLARNEQELESVEADLTALLGDMSECPVCGSVLDHDH